MLYTGIYPIMPLPVMMIWIYTVSQEASKHFSSRQIRRLFVIGALRVNKCDFQFMYGYEFHEMHARLRGSNKLLTLLTLTQIINIT